MKVEVVTSGIFGCPSCEKAKELVKKVIADFSGIEFGEIDSLEEPERIQKLGIVTSGAIVINHELAFSSLPKENVLREKIEESINGSKEKIQ